MHSSNSIKSKATKIIDNGLKTFFNDIYSYLGLGLFFTGTVTLTVIKTQLFHIIFKEMGIFYLLIFATMGLSLYLSYSINNISILQAQVIYWAYTGLNGMILAPVCYMFRHNLATAIFCTAGILFGMSVYAKTTDTDLSQYSNMMFVSLIAILLISIINMFLGNNMLDTLICIAGVFLFSALIAWDHQKLENMYYSTSIDKDKLAVIGALQLYLNVINIFIYILRLLSKRNNE